MAQVVFAVFPMNGDALTSGDIANDIITRNGAGVMVPSDAPEAIDAAVEAWEKAPAEELRQMGEQAHRAAVEKYTYRKLAEDFSTLF